MKKLERLHRVSLVCFFFFYNFLLLKFIYIGKLKEFYRKFPYSFHLDSIPKVLILLINDKF